MTTHMYLFAFYSKFFLKETLSVQKLPDVGLAAGHQTILRNKIMHAHNSYACVRTEHQYTRRKGPNKFTYMYNYDFKGKANHKANHKANTVLTQTCICCTSPLPLSSFPDLSLLKLTHKLTH